MPHLPTQVALPTLIRERFRQQTSCRQKLAEVVVGAEVAIQAMVVVEAEVALQVAGVVEVEVTVEVVASEARGVALQILDVTGSVKTANFLTFHLEMSAKDVNLQKPQVNIIS